MAKHAQAPLFNESIKSHPSGKVILVEVDCSAFLPLTISEDHADGILRFHYCPIPHTPDEIIAANGDASKLAPKKIIYNGKKFSLWGFEVTDIEMTTEQQNPAKLSVQNLNGFVSALCAYRQGGYIGGGLVGAKVRVIQTYVQFLDAANFEDGNSQADPAQAYIQTYYIDHREQSTSEVVTWELSSPADFTGLVIPTRMVTNYCTWAQKGWYKKGFGYGCTYNPATHGNRMFDENGSPVTDPSKDVCGGCMNDCKARFGANQALDFGGFPAASLMRR